MPAPPSRPRRSRWTRRSRWRPSSRSRDRRDRLGVTARNVTALVDALEADDAFGAHTTRASALFARLSASDQRELLRIIRRLSEEIHEVAAAEGVNITVRC